MQSVTTTLVKWSSHIGGYSGWWVLKATKKCEEVFGGRQIGLKQLLHHLRFQLLHEFAAN
jgi:hypothetical protein